MGACTLCSSFDVRREQIAKPGKPFVFLQIGSYVPERSRDVLNVNRVAARGCLVAKGTQGLQIALQRHQIEAAPEL
jgi:hypothetical protein